MTDAEKIAQLTAQRDWVAAQWRAAMVRTDPQIGWKIGRYLAQGEFEAEMPTELIRIQALLMEGIG